MVASRLRQKQEEFSRKRVDSTRELREEVDECAGVGRGLAAAVVPMESHYCSCKRTRVRACRPVARAPGVLLQVRAPPHNMDCNPTRWL